MHFFSARDFSPCRLSRGNSPLADYRLPQAKKQQFPSPRTALRVPRAQPDLTALPQAVAVSISVLVVAQEVQEPVRRVAAAALPGLWENLWGLGKGGGERACESHACTVSNQTNK